MVRKILFQLHLWIGLILGTLFVLIGLSGSIAMFRPLFHQIPAVQVTSASTLALDKGLVAARATTALPQYMGASIRLPDGPDRPVLIGFGGETPLVLTDPGTGRALATFTPEEPAWFRAICDFHSNLSMRNGSMLEGWLGLIMVFLSLTGLYLWWPRAGQWKYGFIVRRKAKGMRFHRELHSTAGIWTLAVYLVVIVTGVSLCFPITSRAVVTSLTREGMTPRNRGPVVTASAGATLIGPDAALAVARTVSNLPVVQLRMPDWEPGWPNLLAISVVFDSTDMTPVYIDPFRGTVIRNPSPLPKVDRIRSTVGTLHVANGWGPVWKFLVFISGVVPLLFFVTGLIMWLKKRQARFAMNLPMPESTIEG